MIKYIIKSKYELYKNIIALKKDCKKLKIQSYI